MRSRGEFRFTEEEYYALIQILQNARLRVRNNVPAHNFINCGMSADGIKKLIDKAVEDPSLITPAALIPPDNPAPVIPFKKRKQN